MPSAPTALTPSHCMTAAWPAPAAWPRPSDCSRPAPGADLSGMSAWEAAARLSARAYSVADGLGACPGQRPLPTEQDLREALRGFLAAPIALKLTPHLGNAGQLAAGLGDRVGLIALTHRVQRGEGQACLGP